MDTHNQSRGGGLWKPTGPSGSIPNAAASISIGGQPTSLRTFTEFNKVAFYGDNNKFPGQRKSTFVGQRKDGSVSPINIGGRITPAAAAVLKRHPEYAMEAMKAMARENN